jgi:hypothetical protein
MCLCEAHEFIEKNLTKGNQMAKLDQLQSFTEVARPVIKWLCENVHLHHTAIITPTSAELLEGHLGTGQILDYVKD